MTPAEVQAFLDSLGEPQMSVAELLEARHGADDELARVTEERDRLLRELSAANQALGRTETERDAARARVAELEGLMRFARTRLNPYWPADLEDRIDAVLKEGA